MNQPLVAVIIPNWNGRAIIEDCLVSLSKQTFKDFEIIVVDNNSQDESVDFIKAQYPEIKIIENKENYGFARAINIGVKAAKSLYVALLNNDTKVDKLWLENLVKCMKKHSDVSSVGSKLLNFYDPKIIDGVGITINEVGQARSIGYNEKDSGQFEKEQYVLGVTGGASLYKRDIFIKAGLFDESYFMYSEEVDWAFRSQFLGYKAVYCPKAVVLHKHKATSKKLPQYLEYWQFKNMTATIIKDFPASLLIKNFRWFKILLVHLNTIFYQLKKGYIWPPIMTELWLLVNLPKLLMQRLQIQSSKKVSDNYIEQFLTHKKITFWGAIK